jgi:peptidylprolyl isomerase
MMGGTDYKHFPEIRRQVVGRAEIVDDLADRPMFRHRDQVALHQAAGGFLGIAQRLFDRGAIVGLHRLKNSPLVVLVEVFDQGNGVVGLKLAGDVRNLLRLHFVEQTFANVIIHFGEHIGADDAGERFHQPLALVARGKLDQIGDIGRVQRLDELARGLVIALVDGIEHPIDELRPQPVLFVDRGVRGFGGGGDVVAFAHSLHPLFQLVRLSYVRRCSGATRRPLLSRPHNLSGTEFIMADADRLTLSLSTGGDVVIRLRPDLAPGHVQRITDLASSGFYNGVAFHRVIPGFMAQGGDPTGTGMSGSDLPDLKAEFSSAPHVRGTVSMARKPDPDSANSQFFICFDEAGFLDGQYTVWGEVESGMEHVDALPVGEPPREPGKIVTATISKAD